MLHYEKNMTAAMKDTLQDFREQHGEEVLLCTQMLRDATEAANVSLPCEGENGEPVQHGCRLIAMQLEEYWKTRLNLALKFEQFA